uniref:ATP-dependent DNA helicase n=1 Tax=Anopheles albimanus TaxID=7167 RepID=A0A182FWW4_ANOAL
MSRSTIIIEMQARRKTQRSPSEPGSSILRGVEDWRKSTTVR